MSAHALYQRALANPTTTTPAASSTSSNNGSNNIGSGMQGKNPPIIIAFLAVGVFLALMIAVYGWRRVVMGRQVGAYQGAGNGSVYVGMYGIGRGARMRGMGTEREIGERPVVWDLWTAGREGEKGSGKEKVGWVDIMVSADHEYYRHVLLILWQPISTSIARHTTTTPPSCRLLSPTTARHSILSHLAARNTNNNIPRPEITVPVAPPPDTTSTLQIAVAIAMPSRRVDGDGEGEGESDMVEYSLGMVRIPWEASLS